jgi:hypothetical protein
MSATAARLHFWSGGHTSMSWQSGQEYSEGGLTAAIGCQNTLKPALPTSWWPGLVAIGDNRLPYVASPTDMDRTSHYLWRLATTVTGQHGSTHQHTSSHDF